MGKNKKNQRPYLNSYSIYKERNFFTGEQDGYPRISEVDKDNGILAR